VYVSLNLDKNCDIATKEQEKFWKLYTFRIVLSSIGPSVVLLFIIPKAFLKEICIAASISFEHSSAVELAAATTVATVPNFAEPFPLKESTASL